MPPSALRPPEVDPWFEVVPPWDSRSLHELSQWMPAALTRLVRTSRPTATDARDLAECVARLRAHLGEPPSGGPGRFRDDAVRLMDPDAFARHLRWAAHRLEVLVGTSVQATGAGAGSTPVGPYGYGRRIVECYDAHRRRHPAFGDALRALAREVAQQAVVVEYGPGTGFLARHMADHAAAWIGVELSEAMSEALQEEWSGDPSSRLLRADVMRLPVADATVGLVIEHETLSFADEPLLAAAEAIRVLRPGGRFVRLSTRAIPSTREKRVSEEFHRALMDLGHGPFRLLGKGTDPRVTAWLTAAGASTESRELGSWVESRDVDHVLEPLRARAYPYLDAVPDEHVARAAAAAVNAVPGSDEPCDVRVTLTALVTTVPAEPVAPRARVEVETT